MPDQALTIVCPHCHETVSLDDALTHQIEEQALESLKTEHKKELERAINNAYNEASKKIKLELETNLVNTQKERDEEKDRNKKLIEQINKLLEEVRLLRRKDEERDNEMKKKILEEENRIRQDATKTAQEKSQFELLELKKQLEDTKRALSTANMKLSQKSQQLQGEVMELDLEKKLLDAFIYDEITGVNKGKLGADIIQKVKNQSGKLAGTILWEAKRANWSPAWLPKLREDGRNVGATLVVLVTEILPKDIIDFGLIEGVLVVSYHNAVSLAALLRRTVMLIASAKLTAANKDENLEMLYRYIQSDTFRNRFEAFAEGIKEMENDLETERSAMERIWKKRKIQLEKIRLNSARMYGELQGTLGKALPDIKALELPDDIQ